MKMYWSGQIEDKIGVTCRVNQRYKRGIQIWVL